MAPGFSEAMHLFAKLMAGMLLQVTDTSPDCCLEDLMADLMANCCGDERVVKTLQVV